MSTPDNTTSRNPAPKRKRKNAKANLELSYLSKKVDKDPSRVLQPVEELRKELVKKNNENVSFILLRLE